MHDEAKKVSDHNALPHSLALTVRYLRLRMEMEDVPLSLKTSLKIENFGRSKTNKCTFSSFPSKSSVWY